MFKSSKIFLDETSIAEQLRQRRQQLDLKLDDIAKKLMVNQKYLEALEHGNYQLLPRGVYGHNFLKEYSTYLGLDYKRLLSQFNDEKKVYELDKTKQIFKQQVERRFNLPPFGVMARNVLIILALLVTFVYLGGLVKKTSL